MTISRLHPSEGRSAANDVAANDVAANDAAGIPVPVDLTVAQVVFSDGAPVPLSRTKGALHWVHEHNHVHVHVHMPHVHMPHLPPPDPAELARHYAYFEQAMMSREMDRL